MRIAVVLPALNEARHLSLTGESLLAQTRPFDRLIVVDGGSHDDTLAIARQFTDQVLVAPGVGRGGQIAVGVAWTTEEVVLIAHADMVFPPTALETIQRVLMRYPACPGGSLGHRFDRPGRAFRAIEWWDRRRALRGFSYGDQAQFFRRSKLESHGGFPNLPLMEDVELARRLRILGRPAYLDLPVAVSSRRYETHGWARVAWRNWKLRQEYRREGEAACWRLFRKYYG